MMKMLVALTSQRRILILQSREPRDRENQGLQLNIKTFLYLRLICVPEAPFHVLDELQSKIQNFLLKFCFNSLRRKCPNTEFFLVGIFPHLDWIRRDTDQKKLRIQSECGKIRTRKNSVFGNFSRSDCNRKNEIQII